MRIVSKSAGIHAILCIFIAYYLAACLGSDFLHTHEPDAEFHDNCPACQWQSMSQDDFSNAIDLLDVMADPLSFVGYKPYVYAIVLHSDGCGLSCFSRAPPPTV